MRTLLLVWTLGLVSAGLLLAQDMVDDAAAENVFQLPSQSVLGILDPSRIDVSNQVTFGYTSGGAYRSGSYGLYQNRLSYQLSDPLRVTLLLGYQFASPYDDALSGMSERDRFLPGLSVSYVPSDNFALHFEYRRLSAYSLYDRHDPWSTPWAAASRPGW